MDKSDNSTTKGAVFHLRRGEGVVIFTNEGPVEVRYEGKAHGRGNRISLRTRFPMTASAKRTDNERSRKWEEQ